MNLKSNLLIILFANIIYCDKTPIYICTAADSKYFNSLLNFIGSVHKSNFENLAQIAVFDLGFTDAQKFHLNCIEKLSLHEVEKVNPDIITPFTVNNLGKIVPGWYAWKPVAISQALNIFPYVLWLDAGTIVLRSLENISKYIKEHGYFLCTIGDGDGDEFGRFGHCVEWQTTKYVYNKFDLSAEGKKNILHKEALAGCIIGVSNDAKEKFLLELVELAKDLKNYIDDGTTPDGFGTGRHDQALLSILGYLKNLKVFKQDYRSHVPMILDIGSEKAEFNITWNGGYVNNLTDIYTSRGNLKNFEYYLAAIKYKK